RVTSSEYRPSPWIRRGSSRRRTDCPIANFSTVTGSLMNAEYTRATPGGPMKLTVALVLVVALVAGSVGPAAAQAKPEGEMRWALYITLSPNWFDPAEVVGVL